MISFSIVLGVVLVESCLGLGDWIFCCILLVVLFVLCGVSLCCDIVSFVCTVVLGVASLGVASLGVASLGVANKPSPSLLLFANNASGVLGTESTGCGGPKGILAVGSVGCVLSNG